MRSQQIRIEIDYSVDAAYIRLSNAPVVTTQEVTDEVLVDLDAMGIVVGIEVLSLAADIPFHELNAKYHVHSDVIDAARQIRPTVGSFVANFAFESSSHATAATSGMQAQAC